MAGSLKPSGLQSVDSQRPTSGLVGRADSVQSPTMLDRRSLLVSLYTWNDTVTSRLQELRTFADFPLTKKVYFLDSLPLLIIINDIIINIR